MVTVLTASPTRPKVRTHVGTASSRRYERRRPEKTPLYNVVAEHLEGWLENRAVAEQPVSAHVERELLFRKVLLSHPQNPPFSGDAKVQNPNIPDGSRNGKDVSGANG
jgi:hypothetical protein